MQIPIPKILRRKGPRPTPGAPPGTLLAQSDLPPPHIKRLSYNADGCESEEVTLQTLEKALVPRAGKVIWLDIQGLGDAEILRRIGEALGLHPLTTEDITHLHQRPKIEEFDDYLFMVLRELRLLDDGTVNSEQIAMVLKPGILVTFQERPGDGFEPVRRRLRENKGNVIHLGADYLFYALLDVIIDNYFPVIDAFSTIMDDLDDRVREDPRPEVSRGIHTIRRELRLFRRSIWPLREVTTTISRNPLALISSKVRTSFRDCYDHVVQVVDFLEGSRERATELADLYLIMMGEKSNQVMKTLTIIATIFIPLTFLCGIYGMNFDPQTSPYNLPELRWRFGYPVFWLICILTVFGMLWLFKRKGWIFSSKAKQ